MIFYFLLAAVASLESNEIQPHTDTVKCICDLTLYSCDSYCCCDLDCTASVVQTWSSLSLCEAEEFSSYSKVYCEKINGFFQENSNVDTIDPLFKLLCIQYNNAPDWGRYNTLIDSSNPYSQTVVDSLLSNTETYPDTLSYFYRAPDSGSLAAGDRLRIKNSVLNSGWTPYDGTWVLPAPGFDGECLFAGPVLWLNSVGATKCSVNQGLSSSCSSKLSTSLFTDFIVSSTTIVSSGTSVSVSNWFKVSNTGTVTTGALSTSYSNGVCSNAVVQVDYRVFTNTQENGITSIQADIYLQDFSDGDFVQQTVTLKFLTSSSSKDLSGNPGYIIGKPLLTATGSNTTVGINSKFLISGISGTGECLTSSGPSGLPFNFGQDSVFTCSVSVSDLNTFCASDSISSLFVFKGLSFTHIGKYGNITTTNIDDWVQINSTIMPKSVLSGSTCTVPNLLVFDVIFTQVGPYENPQNKVIQVNKYYKTSNWTSPTNPSNFLLTVSFNYINYDSNFDPYALKWSSISKILSDDVVYVLRNNAVYTLVPLYIILIS